MTFQPRAASGQGFNARHQRKQRNAALGARSANAWCVSVLVACTHVSDFAAAHQARNGDKGIPLRQAGAVLHRCRDELDHLAKHLQDDAIASQSRCAYADVYAASALTVGYLTLI